MVASASSAISLSVEYAIEIAMASAEEIDAGRYNPLMGGWDEWNWHWDKTHTLSISSMSIPCGEMSGISGSSVRVDSGEGPGMGGLMGGLDGEDSTILCRHNGIGYAMLIEFM
jgi:hypothetical protein